jgi:hypothetical protein
MISFSAAHGGNNPAPFGAQNKNKAPASPLENVTMNIHKNQICSLQIPHGTPRAGAIRQWLSTYCLNPHTNVRLWIFRRNINWTTIALDSTDEQPKLTINPAEAAIVTRREMNRCPEVGEFKVLDWNNNIITDDFSIDTFDFDPIVPINEPSDSPVPATGMATGTSTNAKTVQTSVDDMRAYVDGLSVNFTRDLEQLQSKITATTAEMLDEKLTAMESRQAKVYGDKFDKLSEMIVGCTINSKKSVGVPVQDEGTTVGPASVASSIQSPAGSSTDAVARSPTEVAAKGRAADPMTVQTSRKSARK